MSLMSRLFGSVEERLPPEPPQWMSTIPVDTLPLIHVHRWQAAGVTTNREIALFCTCGEVKVAPLPDPVSE